MNPTAWCIAIGRSKVTRSFEYSSACSYALLAEPVLGRHADVVERERRRVGRALAHLLEVLLDHDPGRAHLDDERRHPAAAGGRIGLGEDDRPLGVARVRDERLRAVEDVVVAVAHRGGAQRGDVGARPRLRERERAEDRLFDQRRQPAGLLLGRAEEQDGARAEPVGGDGRADPGAAPVELFADEQAVEGAEAGAAVLLGHVEVHQAERVRLGYELRRVALLHVVLRLVRPDLAFRKGACEPAQLLLLLGQGKGDARRSALFDRHHSCSPHLIDCSVKDYSRCPKCDRSVR
jgi:hypothetical protein